MVESLGRKIGLLRIREHECRSAVPASELRIGHLQRALPPQSSHCAGPDSNPDSTSSRRTGRTGTLTRMRIWQVTVNAGMVTAFVLLAVGGALMILPDPEQTLLRNAGMGIVILAGAVYLAARVRQLWRTNRP